MNWQIFLAGILSVCLQACGGGGASNSTADTQAPSVPSGLAVDQITSSSMRLQWQASSDDRSVSGYDLWVNGAYRTTVNETRVTLSGLLPQTGYALQVRARDTAGNLSAFSAVRNATTATASPSSGAQYWVSTSGQDSNACSQVSPCRTIQRGISLLQPGDTLNILAGTYLERSASSTYTTACDWFGTPVSLCMPRSGTASAPITIQAAPGAERQVILDGEGVRAAIHLLGKDDIHFKGLLIRNSRSVGIVNWSQAQNEVADEANLAVGIRIENSRFENTRGAAGDNVSSIAMWGSKDWVVRNNLIDGVSADAPTLASGIQSYGVINALVENNTIRNVDFGIFWKDHFVQDLAARTLWQESEIRYNDITARDTGVRIGIRGADSVEAGHNHVHHNIVRAPNGLLGGMAGAFALSGDLRVEHNLFDAQNASGSVCVSADSFRTLTLQGNLMLRCGVGLELIDYSGGGGKYVRLTASNWNVWDDDFQNIVDRYSSTQSSGVYQSLTDWRALTTSQRRTVTISNPDSGSTMASVAALFTSTTTYTYRATSPANHLLGAGRNAGPYERGTETFGVNF